MGTWRTHGGTGTSLEIINVSSAPGLQEGKSTRWAHIGLNDNFELLDVKQLTQSDVHAPWVMVQFVGNMRPCVLTSPACLIGR